MHACCACWSIFALQIVTRLIEFSLKNVYKERVIEISKSIDDVLLLLHGTAFYMFFSFWILAAQKILS